MCFLIKSHIIFENILERWAPIQKKPHGPTMDRWIRNVHEYLLFFENCSIAIFGSKKGNKKFMTFCWKYFRPKIQPDIEINRLEQIGHLLGHQTEQRVRVTYALISNWARLVEKWKLAIDNKKIFVEIKTKIEYFKPKCSFDFECFRAKENSN